MKYTVILRNIADEKQFVVLAVSPSMEHAKLTKRDWRQVLGGKKSWTIDRCPGVDTLDHLALTIVAGE